MDIRTVTVELLRAGPRHNQLISPLTQYLGVCGNAPAGRVTLPYEHGDLEQRLQELRYGVTAEDDPSRPSKMLERTGRDIADILSGIPGVAGTLNPEEDQPQTLTHLRIVLSASELAMLPFEASKVPTGTGAGTVWLALQARAPVCITRHIRSVSSEGIRWPTAPRSLFIAGPDTPVAEHREALKEALHPWRDHAGNVEHLLDTLEQPKLADVSRAIAAAATKGVPFTHVHILAHGTQLDAKDRYSPVGIVLNDDEDAVSGQRLATTLTSVADRGVNRPAVVTLASCDSGKQADVRTTDASVAHDLHDQGIPLVVASQFPLTVEGSIPFVARFYEGQLWGEHPLISLYAVRLQLHSQMGPDTHDWASLVVYEALPANLSEQFEELRYWQTRRAQEGALQRMEAAVANANSGRDEQDGRAAVADVDAMLARLPKRGPYALECAGLRAAAHKRIALVAAQHAVDAGPANDRADALLAECLTRLDSARAEYWRATKAFLGPSSEPVRKKSNLHWLLGQVLSLDVALGRPLDKPLLTAARLAAEIDLDSAGEDERAWAYVSLTEFALLRLADPDLPSGEREQHAREALANAGRFMELVGRGSEHVATTSRQFDRYIDWWGNPELQWALGKLGVPNRPHWHVEDGLVPTARRIVELLRGGRRPGAPRDDRQQRRAPEAPPAPTARSGAAPLLTKRGSSIDLSASTFAVEMLPAENGDCLLIEYGDAAKPSRLLIDCGAKSAVGTVADWISKTKAPNGHEFELFVLTHIDADHINGVLTLFDAPGFDVRFEDIWFNGWHQISRFLSVKQGEDFSKLLEDPQRALPWNRAVSVKEDKHPAPIVMPAGASPPTFTLSGGLQLTLLSPGPDQLKRLAKKWHEVLLELEPKKSMLGRRRPPPPVTDFASFSVEKLADSPVKKDTSVANGSSIALLAEFGGRAVLLTGDAHADVLVDSIKSLQRERGQENKKLKLDALKLSHHGSANATTIELLSMLDCGHYLVSSNGNIFYHPDRESIARVILFGGKRRTLHFNYRSRYNDLWDSPVLKQRYDYLVEYPQKDTAGLRVSL
jgi:beta-lactamase superfamily II metal-dependent hydrolase